MAQAVIGFKPLGRFQRGPGPRGVAVSMAARGVWLRAAAGAWWVGITAQGIPGKRPKRTGRSSQAFA